MLALLLVASGWCYKCDNANFLLDITAWPWKRSSGYTHGYQTIRLFKTTILPEIFSLLRLKRPNESSPTFRHISLLLNVPRHPGAARWRSFMDICRQEINNNIFKVAFFSLKCVKAQKVTKFRSVQSFDLLTLLLQKCTICINNTV